MNAKRASVLSVLAFALMVSIAPAASAGEISGPPGPGGAEGKPTPVADFWSGGGAASICSFSGLNDEIDEFETTSQQSYGVFLTLVMQEFGFDIKEAKAFLGESPGVECNPTRAPFGNPKK